MGKQSKFAVGTTVKLKSGGPDMSVKTAESNDGSIYAQWFAGKKLEQGNFPIESLEEVKPTLAQATVPKAE